jgi:hypothetical protein
LSKAETHFYKIRDEISEGKKGKMFGAECIKAPNGKVIAIFWKDRLILKLQKQDQIAVLNMEGTEIGKHLYDENKPMTGWVSLPYDHHEIWLEFANRALKNV